jgi:predicted SprT family Zn-dependent metalloprotease
MTLNVPKSISQIVGRCQLPARVQGSPCSDVGGCGKIAGMHLRLAKSLAVSLMRRHRLKGWKFQYSTTRSEVGATCHSNKTIYMSAPLVESNDLDLLLQGMLHEIAHALLPPDAKHGPRWKQKAREIGFTGSIALDDSHLKRIPRNYKVVLMCPKCKTKKIGYRGHPYIISLACGECARANPKTDPRKFRAVVAA